MRSDSDLLKLLPGFEIYAQALLIQEGLGHGRIEAQQHQVIFQHLLILRRQIVQDAGLNFYAVQEYAEKKLKRLKITVDTPIPWMLATYALTLEKATGDTRLWDELRAMLS